MNTKPDPLRGTVDELDEALRKGAKVDDAVVQRLSGIVLKREEVKTDRLVIPLFAAVAARCVLATEQGMPAADEGSVFAEAARQARMVVDLAERAARDDTLHMEPESYAAIFDGLILGWKSMDWWCPTGFIALELRGFLEVDDAPAALMAKTIRWLTTSPLHSLTEGFIVASFAMLMQDCKPTELPPLSAKTRKLRVVFADRLRRAQLNTWPKVLAAATAEWTPETLSRLAFKYARSTGLMMQMNEEHAAKLRVLENDARGAAQEPDERPTDRAERTMEAQRMANLQAAMSLVDDAADEIGALRAERDRLRQERDRFADRHARAQSRIETLEGERRGDAQARRDAEQQVHSLTKERDWLAEQLAIVKAVDIALSPGAPSLPPDVLKDRRVMVFTGLESGHARDGLAERFYAFGAARVDCYWTDKERGPDVFPSDAVIAIDLKFMGHSESHSVEQRARSAGAWYYRGRHGASTMADATAAAFRVHCSRVDG